MRACFAPRLSPDVRSIARQCVPLHVATPRRGRGSAPLTAGVHLRQAHLVAHASWNMNPSSSGHRDVGQVHCERCGSRAMAAVGGIEFCIECGLYVCAPCWQASQHRCETCAGAESPRRGRGSSVPIARRADRRLREVALEAAALARGAASSDADPTWTDHACLVIKAAEAESVGALALGRLNEAAAEHAWPLVRRFHQHALVASSELERAASRLGLSEGRSELSPAAGSSTSVAPEAQPLIPPEPPQAASKQEPGDRWRRVPVALTLAAAIIVVGVVLAPGWLRQPPRGEGVLGGGPSTASPVAAAAGQEMSPSPTAPLPAASPASLELGFDTVRMGGGIGEGWIQSDGAAVAAIPTAVDRSARLEVISDAHQETCRVVDPPLADASRFSVEVILDPLLPAVATIELRDPAGDPTLMLTLDPSRATLASGDGQVVAEAAGLTPGRWYGIEVVTEGGAVWRMLALEDPPGPGVEVDVAMPAFAPVAAICLGAEGPPDSAVNYDDVAVTND
jgi:hypothetical protein